MVRGKEAPGWVGTDCCGMFMSLCSVTLGGLRNCSTDGAPRAGGMAGAYGAVGAYGTAGPGRNPYEELPGGQTGSGG